MIDLLRDAALVETALVVACLSLASWLAFIRRRHRRLRRVLVRVAHERDLLRWERAMAEPSSPPSPFPSPSLAPATHRAITFRARRIGRMLADPRGAAGIEEENCRP